MTDASNERLAIAQGLMAFAQNDLLDEDGRPLGEVSSRHYREENTLIKRCPYRDSRLDAPMNASALQQMSTRWNTLVGFVAALVARSEHPVPTVHQAFTTCMALSTAPLLATLPVDVHLSTLYKASLGFSQVLSSLLLGEEGVADVALRDLGDGEAFCSTLDEGRWLHGQVQVCAGPMPLIRELFDVLAGLSSPNPLPLPEPLERAAAHAEWATTVVGCLSVHLLKLQDCVRRNQTTGLDRAPAAAWFAAAPPWLRALQSVPNRPIAHVARLFPSGALPHPVRTLMETTGPPPAHTAALSYAVGV